MCVNKALNLFIFFLFANFSLIFLLFAYMIKSSKFAQQEDKSFLLLIPKFHDAIYLCCANITPLLSVRYLYPPPPLYRPRYSEKVYRRRVKVSTTHCHARYLNLGANYVNCDVITLLISKKKGVPVKLANYNCVCICIISVHIFTLKH